MAYSLLSRDGYFTVAIILIFARIAVFRADHHRSASLRKTTSSTADV